VNSVDFLAEKRWDDDHITRSCGKFVSEPRKMRFLGNIDDSKRPLTCQLAALEYTLCSWQSQTGGEI
jgi:hypothetical protein